MHPRTRTAAPRYRALGLLLALVPALLITGLAGSASAAASTSYGLNVSTTVKGAPSPYQLSIYLSKGAGPGTTSMSLYLTRTASTGNHPTQTHSFTFNGVSFGCQSDLSKCTLNTHSAMGKYGKIDMTFSPTRKASTSTYRCKDNSKSSTYTTRTGVMKGTLRFVTGTKFFKTITNGGTQVHVPSRPSATASKSVFYKNCPAPPPGPTTCPQYLSLYGYHAASAGTTGESGSRSLPKGKATLQIYWSPSAASTIPATVSHTISGYVPASNFSASTTLSTGKINLASLAPMAGGEGKFTATKAATTYGTKHCKTKSRQGVLRGGKANLDGWGQKQLVQSDYATLSKEVKV
jgi:hypothetical protein